MELEELLLKKETENVLDEEIKDTVANTVKHKYNSFYNAIKTIIKEAIIAKYNVQCNNVEEIILEMIRKSIWINFEFNQHDNYEEVRQYLSDEDCIKAYKELREDYPNIPENIDDDFRFNSIIEFDKLLLKVIDWTNNDKIKKICSDVNNNIYV